MTPAVRKFVEDVVNTYGLKDKKTLDIGAYDVNGCVRDLFTNYKGLDQRVGPNVDIVGNANRINIGNERYEVIVCLEMLEHDKRFWLSILEMARVMKKGGHLILTTRGIGYPKHDAPQDYWRFTEDSVRMLLEEIAEVEVKIVREDEEDKGVMAYAIKKQ